MKYSGVLWRSLVFKYYALLLQKMQFDIRVVNVMTSNRSDKIRRRLDGIVCPRRELLCVSVSDCVIVNLDKFID